MNCRKHTFVTMVLAGLLGMPALWGEAASPKGKAPLPEAARTAAEGWSQKEAAKKGTAPVEGKDQSKKSVSSHQQCACQASFQEGGP